jgi:hypothetical protein
MPKLVSNDIISLLEVGIDLYILALNKLYCPQERTLRIKNSKYASVMGLLGSSVELLSKACLVEAKGIQSMYLDNAEDKGVFKYANSVLEELKKDIKSKGAEYTNILNSLNQDEQNEFDMLLSKFKTMQTYRANGLHGGIGNSKDIANICADYVYKYLLLLQKTKKFKAYIKNIPLPIQNVVDREAILEDIIGRLNKKQGDTLENLKSMYIVLPYIPEIEPEWIKALEESNVITKRYDLSYLAKTLTDSHGIYFAKNRDGNTRLGVKYDKDNPYALSVAIQDVRRELTSYRDKFYNNSVNSNSWIGQNKLDLPSYEIILQYFCIDFEKEGILNNDEKLTAQVIWPYVVSAISYQGTQAPIWFLIDKCNELDKLVSILKKQVEISKGFYKSRISLIIELINKKNNNTPYIVGKIISNEIFDVIKTTVSSLDFDKTIIEQKQKIFTQFFEYLSKNNLTDKTLTEAIQVLLKDIDKDIEIIIKYFIHKARYADRMLLLNIFEHKDFKSEKTTIKKMFKIFDFQKFGPSIVND